MANGIQLAVDEYNKDAKCKVGFKKFDSQGSPDKAPALATQIVGDKTIVGLVGPGFSGESLATGKTFFESGLPSISPSATNVTITQQGWTTWHRVIGNDNAQGQADAKYLTGTVGAKKVYVIDDAQDYSKGLATVVKDSLGAAAVGSDEIQVKQTDMSADGHQGHGLRCRRGLLRWLLHRGRPAREAAAPGGLEGHLHVR